MGSAVGGAQFHLHEDFPSSPTRVDQDVMVAVIDQGTAIVSLLSPFENIFVVGFHVFRGKSPARQAGVSNDVYIAGSSSIGADGAAMELHVVGDIVLFGVGHQFHLTRRFPIFALSSSTRTSWSPSSTRAPQLFHCYRH